MLGVDRLRSFWRTTLGPKLFSAAGWMVVVYLSATMLLQYDKDTTDVSGAAFVIASILAALAFTYAGVVSDGDKDDATYAGERLSQGAMFFLMSSLLKYGTITIPRQLLALLPMTHATPGGKSALQLLVLLLQAFLFLVFMSGILVSQLGYKVLGRVLMRRMSLRGKDDYFPPE